MRFYLFALLVAFFFTCVLAVKNQKPIIVTYPPDTPQSVVDEAIEVFKKAGDTITHEYSLIKGFAAKASEATIETLKAMGQAYVPIIENDNVVGINDS